MTNRFAGGIRTPIHVGLRRADVRASREAVWDRRVEEDVPTRYADVIARKPQPAWGDSPEGSDLWQYGFRRAGWWIKPRLEGVVFRPYLYARKDLSLEDGGVYDHDYRQGAFWLLWGSSYGVPVRRTLLHYIVDRHYREVISCQ